MNDNINDLLSILSKDMSAEDMLFAHYVSDISVAITSKRVEMGLTQKELAERLGKTQAVVSKWENGEVNFTLKTLIEIAQKLGLELNISLKQPVVAKAAKVIPLRYYSSPPIQYTTSSELKEM